MDSRGGRGGRGGGHGPGHANDSRHAGQRAPSQGPAGQQQQNNPQDQSQHPLSQRQFPWQPGFQQQGQFPHQRQQPQQQQSSDGQRGPQQQQQQSSGGGRPPPPPQQSYDIPYRPLQQQQQPRQQTSGDQRGAPQQQQHRQNQAQQGNRGPPAPQGPVRGLFAPLQPQQRHEYQPQYGNRGPPPQPQQQQQQPQRRQRPFYPRGEFQDDSSRHYWTDDEDRLILDLKGQGLDFPEMVPYFQDLTAQRIMNRYRNINVKGSRFTNPPHQQSGGVGQSTMGGARPQSTPRNQQQESSGENRPRAPSYLPGPSQPTWPTPVEASVGRPGTSQQQRPQSQQQNASQGYKQSASRSGQTWSSAEDQMLIELKQKGTFEAIHRDFFPFRQLGETVDRHLTTVPIPRRPPPTRVWGRPPPDPKPLSSDTSESSSSSSTSDKDHSGYGHEGDDEPSVDEDELSHGPSDDNIETASDSSASSTSPPTRRRRKKQGRRSQRQNRLAPARTSNRAETPSTETATPLADGRLLAPDTWEQAEKDNDDIWTCIVKNDWTPSGTTFLQSCNIRMTGLAVKKGQEGYTIGAQEMDENGVLWMSFRLARNNTTGWARKDNLAPGRKAGPVTIFDDSRDIFAPGTIETRGSVLQKTVKMLCSTIIAEKPLLVRRGADQRVLDDLSANSNNFQTLFLNAIPRDVRVVIDGGDFTFDDLWQIPFDPKNWITSNTESRVVIYLILFQGINGVPGHDGVGFYTGKSINSGNRRSCHEREFGDPGRLAKYYFDMAMAQFFDQIAVSVFEKTGWKVPLGQGLNWKTPLTEFLARHTSWTCQVFTPDSQSGPVRVYRSTNKAVKSVFNSSVVTLFEGGSDNRGFVQVTLNQTIEYPKHVYLVVEIYTGQGKRHPVPYARLPEPGPFTGWQDLNRIGIRCEWQEENGQWKTCWIQATDGPFIRYGISQRDEASLTEKAAAAYPHVQYNEGELFPWIKQGPPILIKEISYDHRTQAVIIKDQQKLKLDPPRLVSFNENRVMLTTLYGSNLYFQPTAGLIPSKLGMVPKKCAVCQKMEDTPGWFQVTGVKNCPEQDNKPCRSCFMLRRPCVWIQFADLQEPHGRFKFIRIPRKDLRGAQNIDGPSLVETKANEPTAEEDEDSNAAIAAAGDTEG